MLDRRTEVNYIIYQNEIKTAIWQNDYFKDTTNSLSNILSELSALGILKSSRVKVNIQPEKFQIINKVKYSLKLSIVKMINLMLFPICYVFQIGMP